MPEVTAWMTPTTTVRTWDHRRYGTRNHIAGVEFDRVNIHIGGVVDASGDAEIVAACGALIDAIETVRKAAMARMAVDVADALLDPGDHFLRPEPVTA